MPDIALWILFTLIGIIIGLLMAVVIKMYKEVNKND